MGTRSGLSTASSSSAGRPASSVDAGPDCADWYASRSSADVPALFCAPQESEDELELAEVGL